MGLRDAVAGAFSFLGTRSRSEEIVAEYVIREHRSGRPLAEVVQDDYVTNRCNPEQLRRLLERPEVVHAVGSDTVESLRADL